MKASDVVVAAVALVFLGFVGIGGCTRMAGFSRCLANGYPDARQDFMLRVYCVKRVDQTDVVVPLSEVGK